MSCNEHREVVLRIRPGETVDEFTSRIADRAPRLTPDLADRLRGLLEIGSDPGISQRSMPQPARPKAA